MAESREFGYIRKLPSGRYQASYIGPDLQRYNGPVTFEAKDLAIVWLHNEKKLITEAAADEMPWLSPAARREEARRLAMPKVTFGEYGARWIDERRNSKGQPLRPLTQKDYRHVLATYLVPTFGKRPIDQIARVDVRAWHASLSKSSTLRSRTKAYGLLRAIMNSAVDDDLIPASPVHIRGAGAAAVKRPVEPATPAEIDVMAANIHPDCAPRCMSLPGAPSGTASWPSSAGRTSTLPTARSRAGGLSPSRPAVRLWGRRSRTRATATSRSLHTSGRSSRSTSRCTSGQARTRCSSQGRLAATCGTR